METSNETSNRAAFTFFRSYWETVNALPNQTTRAALYDAIFGYVFGGTLPDFSTEAEPWAAMAWRLIFPHLKASRTRSENGRKGGAPKGNNNNPHGRKGREETNQENNLKPTEETSQTNQENNLKPTNKNKNKKEKENIKRKKVTQKKDRGDFATAARSLSDEVSYFSPRSRAEISPYNFGEGETYPDNETAAIDSEPKNGGEAVADRSTALGVGEYLRPDGLRTYGKGAAIVPQDAPPRPSRGTAWDSTRQRWTHKGRAADD